MAGGAASEALLQNTSIPWYPCDPWFDPYDLFVGRFPF